VLALLIHNFYRGLVLDKKFVFKRRGDFGINRKWFERYLPVLIFTVVLILLGVYSFNISRGVNHLTSNLDEFYNHPYKVRNAVSEFNLDAMNIVLLWSGHTLEDLSAPVLEAKIQRKLDALDSTYSIIKNNYLGDSEDTRALWEAYATFKNYIHTTDFSLDKLNHVESDYVEINLLFQNIVNELEPVEKHVTASAANYMNQNIIEKSYLLQKLNQQYLITIVFFVVGLISTFYLLINKNLILYREREKFIKAIESAPVPTIIHKNGIIELISKEWVKLAGYTKEDIPTLEEWSRKAYGDDQVFNKDYINKLYELDVPKEGGIWTVKTKFGRKINWRFRSGPLGDGFVFSTAIDVTEEYKKQKQIDNLFDEKLKLATAVDQSPASIIMTNTNGNIEYVNNFFTELTGYSLDEVLGKKPSILKSGFQDERFFKDLWETISSGNVWTGELQNKAKDGTLFWELSSIYPINDSDGKITNYIAIKENITKKKLAQQALIQSEKKYRDVFTRSTDACLILKDGVYIDCNNAALKALGMKSKNELIGLKPSDIAPEFQEDGSRSDSGAIEKMIKASNDKHLRFEWLHKDVNGEVFPSEVMLTKIEEEDEEYFYVVWRDIADRKIKEEKLRESEQKLKAITNNLEGAVYRYIQYEDRPGAFNYISNGAEKLYGLTQEQVMNDETSLWNQIIEEDLDGVAKASQKSKKELSLLDHKFRIKTPDGTIKWVRATTHPIKDVENKCTIWDTIVVDVTNNVKLEEKINEQLEEKTILLAEVHHRVKNNLAVISGLLELQMFSNNNSEVLDALGASIQRIKAIAIIHEQIYKTGDFAAISIDESLRKEIGNLLNVYNSKNGIDAKVNYELGTIKVNVNQAIPFGLLINELATNSFKYAFEGIEQPMLNVSLHNDKDAIVFNIQDNGVGFDVDEFESGEDSLTQNLMNVFVAQLGGDLDIKSSPGKGTSITLTFQPILKRGSSSNLV